MKQFDYEGVDKRGRTVHGVTAADSVAEVKAQLKSFGFREVHHVEEKGGSESRQSAPSPPRETKRDDFVERPVDGDPVRDLIMRDDEETAGDEWRRLEVVAKVRKYRRKENIVLAVSLVIVCAVAAYFIYNKITTIAAPQPKIITRSSSDMLSFADVYVKGPDLVFIVYARDWNGNVRVDYKAWDPYDSVIDFGIARLGFIGDHYGGSSEKSGAIKLKKRRYDETIELLVSGDEDR